MLFLWSISVKENVRPGFWGHQNTGKIADRDIEFALGKVAAFTQFLLPN